jgi:serine/threonine protein phosphatase PrpC
MLRAHGAAIEARRRRLDSGARGHPVTRVHVETLEDTGSGPSTEDAMFVQAACFGVFDGATSLTAPALGSRLGGPPQGGAVAAGIARDVFAAGGPRPLAELAHEANQAVAGAMDRAGIDRARPENRWGTTAAVVRIADDRLEWVSVGDSVILAIFDDGTFRPLAPMHDHDRTTKRLVASLRARASALRELLKGDLLAVRALANVEYGVINGEPAADRFIVHGREALAGVRHVLLFTDGLLVPRADPDGIDDLAPIVARFQESGLPGAKDLVRDLESRDPDCRVYPRFKPHDDIAAIALTLEPPSRA